MILATISAIAMLFSLKMHFALTDLEPGKYMCLRIMRPGPVAHTCNPSQSAVLEKVSCQKANMN